MTGEESEFAHDIKSWRHKLKKHLLATVPPFYGAGMGTNRTTVQWNIEKALKNGNFAFYSYDVTICFFLVFFIVLWNHWQPCSGALEHPAIAAMINYTFRLKELHPTLGVPLEDQRLKLESLSVQMFAYTLTMVSNQLCWSTSIPHWTLDSDQICTGPIQDWSDCWTCSGILPLQICQWLAATLQCV